MGLSELLARWSAERVHVLPVEVPGAFLVRVAVEREVAARGWALASSPADADLLVVCGRPDDALAEPVATAFGQLPGPRARVDLVGPDDVRPGLERGVHSLLDAGAQARDAAERTAAGGDGAHEDMNHGDMDHGDMAMAPGGIPLAGGAEDRDGLEMDVLHVPLGPVLTHWPAGLVLRCSLHGDVVAEAVVERVGGAGAPGPADAALRAARSLDAVAALLSLAGWGAGARSAGQVRDACLDRSPDARGRLAGLHRSVARARLLRWMLRGLGPVDQDSVRPAGPESAPAGDVHDRLLALLDRARAELAGDPVPAADPAGLREMLPGLVAGLDVAAVRLVVASLGPDLAADAREVAGA